jgi:CelD/BcsL family acetyltransferase involved in cellulose biosynthesis
MVAVMTEPYRVETIEDLQGLRGLGSDWNEAAPTQNVEPWQSFSWMEAAASSYCNNHSLRVITIRKEGLLTAVAPMVLKPSDQPLRPMRLDLVGGEELKEPNRFVSLEPSSLELLIDNLASERVYPIRLSRIPGDEDSLALIMAKFRKAGWITRTLRMPYPYLELGANPIKKSLREDLRRARRKAEALGEVRSGVVSANTEKELLEQLERGLRIEASGWKGRNGTAIISNEFRKKFFERYACSAWREGSLRLRFLYVNEVAVAVQFAVESAKACWLLNIGYDEQYQHCSPGNLLLGDSIEEAARNGLVRYNLLGKNEPWIKHWTSTSRDSLVLAAYRPNVHGFRAMMSDALYLLRKRLKDRRTKSVKKSSRASGKG